MATPCTFNRVDANEYAALSAGETAVFVIRRVEDGMTRRTRGWEVGTRIDSEYVAFTHPAHNAASRAGTLTFDTLREAKDAVRRMARFGASASAAMTFTGMLARGETFDARKLVSSWLSGRSDVLAQFMPSDGKVDVLKLSADDAATYRGHVLGTWHDYESSRSMATCQKCECAVWVDAHPAPNGIDVSGSAVAINCPRA